MSKSQRNFLTLGDESKEMFGKIMVLDDEAIISFFKFCTKISLKETKETEERLKEKKVDS